VRVKIFSSLIFSLFLTSGAAVATPITTLTPLHSNGSDVVAVYVFSDAGDTSVLGEVGPNAVSNIFCNHSYGSCTAAAIGQTLDLGNTGPGIVFSLTDMTKPNTFQTDALASNGYAQDLVSATVDAGDAGAVDAAYGIFGEGALPGAAAASIALLGQTPGTVITFVGWEDRTNGDFDYNDLIFAFTDPVGVPEPSTLALFAFGLAALAGFGRRVSKARLQVL
jgi:hypothetical protein